MTWGSAFPFSSLFTDISAINGSWQRFFLFAQGLAASTPFEVLENVVALGIFHAVTYLCFLRQFLVIK